MLFRFRCLLRYAESIPQRHNPLSGNGFSRPALSVWMKMGPVFVTTCMSAVSSERSRSQSAKLVLENLRGATPSAIPSQPSCCAAVATFVRFRHCLAMRMCAPRRSTPMCWARHLQVCRAHWAEPCPGTLPPYPVPGQLEKCVLKGCKECRLSVPEERGCFWQSVAYPESNPEYLGLSKGICGGCDLSPESKTPARAGVLVTDRVSFNRPRHGRCGTCASKRRLRSTHWDARSFGRRGIRVPGAAS